MNKFKNYLYNKFNYQLYPAVGDVRALYRERGLKFPYLYKDIEKAIREALLDEEKDCFKALKDDGSYMLAFDNGKLCHYDWKKDEYVKTDFDNHNLSYSRDECYKLWRNSESVADSMVIERFIDSREDESYPWSGDSWMYP